MAVGCELAQVKSMLLFVLMPNVASVLLTWISALSELN